jgi:hypothetical protein
MPAILPPARARAKAAVSFGPIMPATNFSVSSASGVMIAQTACPRLPWYRARSLQHVTLLIPCSRHKSGTANPPSA